MVKICFRLSALMFVISLLLTACSTPDPCPDNPAIGNAGSMINTGNDDYLPMVNGNGIYFTSLREDNEKEGLYYSEIINKDFTYPVKDTSLPLDYFKNSSSPCFVTDKITGYKTIFFAAISENGKANSDIFTAGYSGRYWGKPRPLEVVNTSAYESHPALAPDGSYIVFSSDRPGGFGQTDLYISYKRGNSWTEPENLGSEINTDQQEISPYIHSNGTLLYSSKGFTGGMNYDIIRAENAGFGKWKDPHPYAFPINTEGNETGPTVFKDLLLLSSDRRGGCGGFDIYRFDFCGPVYLQGKVIPDIELPKKGTLELAYMGHSMKGNEPDIERMIVPVDNDGMFSLTLQPYLEYTLEYLNPCIPDFDFRKTFVAPCSDTSTVKMILDVPMPENFTDFTFEQYNVPFFVSGYYMPNTMNNLEALRLKFAYNMIGNDDSTAYIENPGTEYDQYTDDVERALSDAVEFIMKKINYIQGECARGDETLTISVIGYADPRPISSRARYNGSSIQDINFDLKVNRGDVMDNDLLSVLRAYYTAKHLHNKLRQYDSYNQMNRRMLWKITGKGVDDRETLTNELKRRVYIKITID